jgi:hypothetical protein
MEDFVCFQEACCGAILEWLGEDGVGVVVVAYHKIIVAVA